MPVIRPISIILLSGLFAMPSSAADPQQHACLNKAEQRAAVADKKAIPLAQAIKTRREHGHNADLVRARLCHHGDGLVDVLNFLLGRSGRVICETVDAANGEVINGR